MKQETPELQSKGDAALFEMLRVKRLNVSRTRNIPAYAVLHDKTLKIMAVEKPRNLPELSNISGWGYTRIARYGQEFIDVIEEWRKVWHSH